MLPSSVIHDFDTLPPPIAQEQVIDFIAFVKLRYLRKTPKNFADVLAAMPNVGQDTDFNRTNVGWVDEGNQ